MMRLPIIVLLLVFSIPMYGRILLDETMSREEMQKSGVDNLNYSQKMALENWINENFEHKEDRKKEKEQLYLSLNIDNGSRLELSDGRTYEIDPDDRIYTAFWITPFPVQVGPSRDPDYPVKITNLNTETSVNGKQISTREMLKEEKEKEVKEPAKKKEPMQPSKKPPPPPENKNQ